jgi:CRISPR/Cas system-associated exonuclease Cas4 (RecB family)
MELLPTHMVLTHKFCERKLWIEQRLGMEHKNIRKRIFNEALALTNQFEEGIVRSIKEQTTYVRVYDHYAQSHKRALQEAIINHKDELNKLGLSIIDTNYSVWKDLQLPTQMKAQNTYEFMTKNHLYGNELWWNLIPKITFNLTVKAPQIGYSIVVDRVDNYPHNTTPILIRRTQGPPQGIWANHRLELGMAMLALAENGSIIQEGLFAYNSGADQRELRMSPEFEEQIKEQVVDTRKTLSQTSIPPRTTNTNICSSCPHKDQCWDDEYINKKVDEHVRKQ